MKHQSLIYLLSILIVFLLLAGCSQPPVNQTESPETKQEEAAKSDVVPDTVTIDGKTYRRTDLETPATAPSKPVSSKPAASTPVASTPAAPPEPEPAQKQEPVRITLAAGTPIKVVTDSELSTKNQKSGDEFTATLNENITDGSNVIARRGSAVKGVVVESDPGGRVKGVATMTLKITSLTLADGRQVAVDTDVFSVEANKSIKKDATKVGIGAGLGAAIGAIAGGGKGAAIGAGIGGAAGTGAALATHGDPAVVESESLITFNLTDSLTVTLRDHGAGAGPHNKHDHDRGERRENRESRRNP